MFVQGSIDLYVVGGEIDSSVDFSRLIFAISIDELPDAYANGQILLLSFDFAPLEAWKLYKAVANQSVVFNASEWMEDKINPYIKAIEAADRDGALAEALADGTITITPSSTAPLNPQLYDIWQCPAADVNIGDLSASDAEIMQKNGSNDVYFYWGSDSAWHLTTMPMESSIQNALYVKSIIDGITIDNVAKALAIATLDGKIDTTEQTLIAQIIVEQDTRAAAITAEATARGLDITAVTSAYQSYVTTVRQALIDGEITTAEQSAINTAAAALSTAKIQLEASIGTVTDTVVTIKSQASVMNIVTLPNGSESINGWQSLINYENGILTNEFSVYSEAFKLIDAALNYAKMTADGLAFYKAGVVEPFKMVAKIDTGVATNNAPVTLTGFYKPPRIIVSQNSLLAYDATHANQSQRWDVRAENIVGSIDTGVWTFNPVARLSIASAVSTASLSSAYSGATDTTYSASYLTPLDAVSISVSGSLNSYRSTGTSGVYQKRKCICTLQTSPDNATWTNRNAVTVTNGADLSSDPFSLYTAMTQGQYYYRVVFQYSDDTGTFTTTTSYNYFTRVVTPVAWNFTLNDPTKSMEIKSTTVSYSLLANETIISGSFSYNWSTNIPTSNLSYSAGATATVYQNISEVFAGRVTYQKSLSNIWSLYAGATTGLKTTAMTTNSITVSASIAANDARERNVFSGSISNQTLTLQTKIPVTESTTATNSFNSLNASFNLGSTTVLDASGVLNYLAISF